MSRQQTEIADTAPSEPRLTDYDRAHLTTYIRLLDAAAQSAGWEQAASLILGMDAKSEPDRARRAYDSHLARAQWMTAAGYRDLLRSSKE
ncbi:MAG: DNA -binding domain-containing protein [Pseudomonadota bacterium]